MNLNPLSPLSALVLAAAALAVAPSLRAQGNYYSHGDPTAQEQYLLELLNRDRANPGQAGDRLAAAPSSNQDCARLFRFFPGNLGQMNAEFHAIPARPPMGFNSSLLAAARGHTQDMLNTGVVSHTGSNGSTEVTRAREQGYPTTLVSENVADVMFSIYGIDYAFATDFSRSDLGHRHIMMNDNTWYVTREAGFGISNLDPRPDGGYVTEDFGNAGTALAVGVAYRDYDNDNFYAIGEGIGGVVVTSPASSRFTVTTASGGYSLPLDRLPDYTAGTRSVDLVFADPNGAIISRQTVALSGSTQGGGSSRAYDNVKVDLVFNGDGSLRSPGVAAAAQAKVSVVGTPDRGGFVVSRVGRLDAAVTVIYHNGGSASRGVDYEPFSGTLTLTAGQAEAVIPVRPLPGANRTKKVKVFLDIAPGGEYQIGKAQSKVFLGDLP